LIGNIVINLENGKLLKSNVQYMQEHDLVNSHLMDVYS
jgi:hypothetical protein